MDKLCMHNFTTSLPYSSRITNIAFGFIKQGVVMYFLNEIHQEVIEELCELGQYCQDDEQSLAEVKYSDIEYGNKYRLSPTIIAGSILGINDCCLSPYAPKP